MDKLRVVVPDRQTEPESPSEPMTPAESRSESSSKPTTPVDLAKCGVPPRLVHCSRESWRGAFPEVPDDWQAVTIYGPVGTGKTHLAVALMAERIERDGFKQGRYQKSYSGEYAYGAVFFDIQEACERMKPGRDEGISERLCQAELLVFDDLGAERLTDFTLDRVSLVLRYRYNWMLPTIITTNLSLAQMNELDPRMASRLMEGERVKRTGEDQRLA